MLLKHKEFYQHGKFKMLLMTSIHKYKNMKDEGFLSMIKSMNFLGYIYQYIIISKKMIAFRKN